MPGWAHVPGLAKRLRSLRLAAGLTVAEVARRSRISDGTIYKIETQDRNLSLGYAVKLARALGVTLNDLVPL